MLYRFGVWRYHRRQQEIEPTPSFCLVASRKELAMNEHLNNSVILPAWLDHIIFNELGAVYNPDHFKFSYNLDHTKNDIFVYLGTYFLMAIAE